MNTAVKRIRADIRELRKSPSDRYYAEPVEENLFEWHFTIRGPPETEFEGGVYHGRILLPSDYPFKPPNFVFLTPNGRFAVNEKICLSISAHHPEYWQPAWGIRLILEALISFFPTEGGGALGALDWPAEERRKLAVKSQNFVCRHCGRIADLLSEPQEGEQKEDGDKYAREISQIVAGKTAPKTSTEERNAQGDEGHEEKEEHEGGEEIKEEAPCPPSASTEEEASSKNLSAGRYPPESESKQAAPIEADQSSEQSNRPRDGSASSEADRTSSFVDSRRSLLRNREQQLSAGRNAPVERHQGERVQTHVRLRPTRRARMDVAPRQPVRRPQDEAFEALVKPSPAEVVLLSISKGLTVLLIVVAIRWISVRWME